MAKARSLSPVQILGILNATPDSFYDGGRHHSLTLALRQAEKLIADGADWLDVGGESTRPGARAVSETEELRRVIPLIRAIHKKFPKMLISIDTQKAAVAHAALLEGASMVNDVSALTRDPKMIEVVLKHRPFVVLMHMKGNPLTMQSLAKYKNVVQKIKYFFTARIRELAARGFSKNKIIVDPGLGFGKTFTHNLEILYNVRKFSSLGCPVMIGASRKSFLGLSPDERLPGSLACALWAAKEGTGFLRVHDVGATRIALQAWNAIQGKR